MATFDFLRCDFITEITTSELATSMDVRLSFISKSKISAMLNEIIHYVVVLYPNANAKLKQDQELQATTTPDKTKPQNLLIFMRHN